ncbi:MAG: hypothetical protein NTW71_10735 [Deltaproteobacteria bacterium]|nr:hypothetical protein [Deltaproteobacteria bacterium]
MSKLFLDILGNKELVDGYQIEDSIAQKYNLKPGTICPFTHLSVETLSPETVRKAEEAERLKEIKQQKQALRKENPSAVDSKISGYVVDRKAPTKRINHPGESHDFARRRARSGRGPVRRNLILEREEVRMETAKKVPAKPAKVAAKAPAKKTKAPVKAPAKAAAKPAKAKAKAVAKKPAKAKAKVVAKKPAKAKAKAVAKKPAAKKPAKAKK